MSQRQLTEDEQRELTTLNEAVAQALAARTQWLDAKMVECSTLKVGDDIYDLRSGHKVGKVTALFRLYDTHVHCHYEYEVEPQVFKNTSRQAGVLFGSPGESLAYHKEVMARLSLSMSANAPRE